MFLVANAGSGLLVITIFRTQMACICRSVCIVHYILCIIFRYLVKLTQPRSKIRASICMYNSKSTHMSYEKLRKMAVDTGSPLAFNICWPNGCSRQLAHNGKNLVKEWL